METLYLRGTSRQRSPAAPALTSPRTHTLNGGEKEREEPLLVELRRGEKSLWKEEKTKAWGGVAPKKDEAETNQPFSPASPRTDRLHPGPWTISGRICPARTYPTLSCLGKAAATDGGVSVGCVGGTVRVSRKIFSGRTVVLLGFFFPGRESGAPRLNFCCSCCRKPAQRSDWSKNFVTRSYLFGVAAVRHLAKAKDNTAAQQLRIH